MGFLRLAQGGGVSAQVLTHQQGTSLDLWRQIGKPKFEDITLSVGMGMSPPFYKWIASFFTRDIVRKAGSIIGGDFNFVERTKRTFKEAMISEVQIPALDGASKDAAYMTVKVVPEEMEYESLTSNNKIKAPVGLNQPAKLWQAANFSFAVDGMEKAFNRTTKIDAFTIKQQILEYPSGHRTTNLRIPGRLDFPNLTVYIPSVDAKPVIDYVVGRVITRKANTQTTGTLQFMSCDHKELCTIDLNGVDIISAEPEKLDASQDALHMVKVQIQVESMAFKYEDKAVLGEG